MSHLGAAQVAQGVQGHGRSLPRLRLRSRRRPGRSGADGALFHGWRDLRRRYLDRLARPFVAGEDASGMHGANRLGGNGVANSTVFGGIAGDVCRTWIARAIQAIARRTRMCSMPRLAARCIRSRASRATSTPCGKGCWTPCGTMSACCAIAPGLDRGIAALDYIEAELLATGIAASERAFNLTWHDWLNLRSLCEMSRVIALAAQAAREFAAAPISAPIFPSPAIWRPRDSPWRARSAATSRLPSSRSSSPMCGPARRCSMTGPRQNRSRQS